MAIAASLVRRTEIAVLFLAVLAILLISPGAISAETESEGATEEAVWSADMLVVEYTSISIGAASADLFSNIGGSADFQIKSLWSYIPDRDLRLSFEDGVRDAADYTLQVGDLTLEFPEDSSGDSSFKWTEVDVDWEDGQTIAVRIVATSALLEPAANTPATGSEPNSDSDATDTLPVAPTEMSAVASDDGMQLSWDAVDRNVLRYEVLRQRPRECEESLTVLVSDTGEKATAYTDGTVVAGVQYIYAVRAVNDAGVGPRSGGVVVRHVTSNDGTRAGVPAAPTNLRTYVTRDGIELEWRSAEDSTITGYQILRRVPSKCESKPRIHKEDTGSTETEALDGDVQKQVAYEYHVRAINPNGVSPSSNISHVIMSAVRTGMLITRDEESVYETATSAMNVGLHHLLKDSDPETVDYTFRGKVVSVDDGERANACAGEDLGTDQHIYTVDERVETLTATFGGKECTKGKYRVEMELLDADQTVVATVNVVYDVNVYQESLTSEAKASPPTIRGAPQVDETLTADTSAITDEHGLTNVSYSYQWVRNDKGTESNIVGETSSTYTLVAADAGKTIKVRVTFTDDADNQETLTSEATVAVAAAVPTAPLSLTVTPGDQSQELHASWQVPSSNGGSDVTGYKVQWKESTDSWDTEADVSEATVTGTSHTITSLTGGVEYSARVIATNVAGDGPASTEARATPADSPTSGEEGTETVESDSTAAWTATLTVGVSGSGSEAVWGYSWFLDGMGTLDERTYSEGDQTIEVMAILLSNGFVAFTVRPHPSVDFVLTVDETEFASADASEVKSQTLISYVWATTLDWAEDDRVALSLTLKDTDSAEQSEPAENTPATGLPTISGTPQVGQDLTADTSAISDADGLAGVSYSYQWSRNDGNADTDIEEATASTHELSVDDVGKTIQVRVSFTDGADNEETLTSEATDTVAATKPGAPGHLNVFPHDAGALDVYWEDPVSDGGSAITGYKVQWKESADSWDTAADVSETTVTGTTHTITGLTDGVEYTVRVRAVNDAGEGPPSAEVSGTPEEAPIWSATLTVGIGEQFAGYTTFLSDSNVLGALSSDTFTLDDASYTVKALGVLNGKLILSLIPNLAAGFVLVVGTDEFASTDASTHVTEFLLQFQWNDPGLDLPEGEEVAVRLTAPDDNTGICGRTQEVQDAILDKLTGVSDCAKVTDSHLAGITTRLTVRFTSSQAIKSDDFTGLSALTDLQLISDQISALPEDVFGELDSLEILLISVSQLQSLPEEVFEGLGSLKDLTVGERPFRGADEVVLVHQLSALPEDVFDGLDSLEKLDLSQNQLIALPEDVFDGLDSLEKLNLTQNQLTALPEDVFDGLDSLEGLYLHVNQLSALPEDVFDELNSLEILALNSNQLTTLPEDLFGGLGKLESLGLSNNQLSALQEDLFDGLSKLDFLNFSNNQLTTLQEDLFGGLGKLQTLLMANNQISGLPSDVFDGLSRLYRLEMNNNQIAELPDRIFDGIGGLVQLSLGPNPGAPFTFTAELEQQGDDAVVVGVAKGAPFRMSVSLSAEGGLLSAETVTVAAGSTKSDPITVTPSGDGAVTVNVDSAEFVGQVSGYAQTGLGDSLTLTIVKSESNNSSSPATGAPTISGTPQVEQTLTADTSGISDANGLNNVSYQYQWLRDDADIAGQTNSTYELVSADEGRTIKVRVTFNDDAGNAESLTSTATTPIAAQPAETPAVLLTASFANVPADHNGSNFTFQLSFSENVEAGYARIRDHAFTVTGATIDNASRITQGSNQGWNVEVNPTGNEAITITLPETTDCYATGAICTDDSRKLSHPTSAIVAGPPAISVSDATVQEAEGAVLVFSITLSHASSRTVTVDYATSDGTAQAGSDYTAASATLTFNAGETSQTVQVTVLTDSEDESQETLTLTLSNPSQATLADATGAGTIENGESSSGTQEDPPAEDPPVVLLTASFGNMPATHNGSEFTFDLAFSEDFPLSYVTLRDDAFTVDGGNVENAQRKVPGSNQTWTITVKPLGAGTVSITLPETTDCDATGAICTDDERKLSNSTPASIAGPQ